MGKKVEGDAGLLQLASQLTAGKEAKLTIVRDGKNLDITIMAGEGL